MELRDISHILGEYHNSVVRFTGVENETNQNAVDAYDRASDLAIELLASCGQGPDGPDQLGVEVSDDVQTLLTLALFRSIPLQARLETLLERV